MTATVAWTDEASTDAILSADDRAIRAAVREVVRSDVEPRAAGIDAGQCFPAESYQALAAAGLAGLLIPPHLGGRGASTLAYAVAMEEITAACASTSTVYMTQMHCAHPIAMAASPAQQQRCIPRLCAGSAYGALAITEPGAGSDAASLQTTAVRAGDGWSLSGAKTFITTGDRAEIMVVFATVDREAGHRGVTAFLVEGQPAGLRRGRPMHKMGLRGSSTTELWFDDCRLPAEACLGEPGAGFGLLVRAVVSSRISTAAQGIGHAVGAYRAALGWAAQHGLLAGDAQEVQFALASMRTRIAAARALLWSTAALVDRAGTDASTEVSMAKLHCTEIGVEIAAEAVDLLGEEGDMVEHGVERRLRDAKIAEIYDGTNQIQQVLVARDLRKRTRVP
jgi:hypothetical protein